MDTESPSIVVDLCDLTGITSMAEGARRLEAANPITSHNADFSTVQLTQDALAALSGMTAPEPDTEALRLEPGRALTRFLHDQFVKHADVTNYVERAGLFYQWIYPLVPDAALASFTLPTMIPRWRVENMDTVEAVLNPVPTIGPHAMKGFESIDDQRRFVLGKILARLGQMRGLHQFNKMLGLISRARSEGYSHHLFEGFEWQASLGSGATPLTKSSIKRVHREMTKPSLQKDSEALFFVVNGLFLAPPGDELTAPEIGKAIETAISGYLLIDMKGERWDGTPLEPPNLRYLGVNGIVVGYFYARSFRLQGDYEKAYEAIEYSFNALDDGGGLNEMLMGQFEREREAIRFAQEMSAFSMLATDSREEVRNVAEKLRVENAQLIATFTGFFAFVFGALALFFREQETILQGRDGWEIAAINAAILVPAGAVIVLLVGVTRLFFRKS